MIAVAFVHYLVIDVTGMIMICDRHLGRSPYESIIILFFWCPLCTFERSPIDCSPLTAVQHSELVLFWAHSVTVRTILPIKLSAIH